MATPSIGIVQAEMVADTKDFDAPLKLSELQLQALGAAAGAMTDKIAASGVVMDRTARMQQQAVDRMRGAFEREAQQRTPLIELIRVQADQARASELAALKADILARSSTEAAGAETELAAASEAAAGSGMKMQNSLGLIDNTIRGSTTRALADVIRNMSGIAVVMDALPWVAVAAGIFTVGRLALEGAEHLFGFGSAADEARQKLQEDWAVIQRSVQGVNEELTLSNARMGDSIAELEKTPSDGLKTALLEAADAAKKLGDKLDEDLGKVQKLLLANKISSLSELGGDQRGDIGRTIGFAVGQYQKIAPDYEDVLQRSAKAGNWPNYMQARKDEIAALHAALDPEIHTLEDYLAKNQLMPGDKESPAHSEAVQGYQLLTGIFSDLEAQALSERQQHEKRTLQNAQSAEEAQELARRQAMPPPQIAERQRYLVGELDPRFKAMREVEQSMPGSASSDRSRAETAMRMNAENMLPEDAQKNVAGEMTEDLTRSGERWKSFNDAVLAGQEAQAKFREQLALTRTQIEKSTGALTKHAALQRELAIAADAYKAQSFALGARRDQVNGDSSLTDEQRATQLKQLQNQEDADQRAYELKVMEIQAEIDATSALGQFRDSIMKTADEFTNLGHILSENFTRDLDSFNDTLMKVLSTPASQLRGQHPWRNMAAGMAENAGKSALQYGEGALMKMLFGSAGDKKPTGTASDRLHVTTQAEETGATGGGGLLGGLLAKILHPGSGSGGGSWDEHLGLPGTGSQKPTGSQSDPIYTKSAGGGLSGLSGSSGDDSGDDDDGGGFSGIFSGLFGSSGGAGDAGAAASGMEGFAKGGMIPSNMPVLVGENGPEILAGAGGRTVIPNHKIGMGGNVTITNHIDARGSTDPAATEATVHRVMRGYMPQIQAGSKSALMDYNRRVPPSKRI